MVAVFADFLDFVSLTNEILREDAYFKRQQTKDSETTAKGSREPYLTL